MVTIFYDGKPINRSKNLAGILRYLRVVPAKRLVLERGEGESGILYILFNNGASVMTDFASYIVMKEWVAARRNLQGVPVREV